MSEEILLVVNGKRHAVQVAADTPLPYILRNELGLTGPQFGCGEVEAYHPLWGIFILIRLAVILVCACYTALFDQYKSTG
jgi:hypothetical protein